MTIKISKILDSAWNLIDEGGAFIENTIGAVADGKMMLQEELQIVLSHLDKDGIVISALQFLNPASSIAEVIYPVRVVEAKAEEYLKEGKEEESLMLTLDALELRRWNFEMRMGIRKAISINPIKREMIEKYKDIIDDLNDEEKFQEKHKLILERIRLYFENKLEKAGNDTSGEQLWQYVVAIVKSSLLLSDIRTAEDIFKYLDESKHHLDEHYVLQGRIFFGNKDYENAHNAFKEALVHKGNHAQDFMALNFDRWISSLKNESEITRVKKMRDSELGRFTSELGNLPLSLFKYKMWELQKIVEKITK